MLCWAQVAAARMHRNLINVRHDMLFPRPTHATMSRHPGLSARAVRAFHEHNRQQMDPLASVPHAESTGTGDGASGTSTHQSQPPSRALTVLEAREQMRNAVEPEAHRIAGVTFEGRQEAVQKLQAGEALKHAPSERERAVLYADLQPPVLNIPTGNRHSSTVRPPRATYIRVWLRIHDMTQPCASCR